MRRPESLIAYEGVPASSSREWNVVSYGHEYARERVEAVAAEWDRLGRPGLDRLQASLYAPGVEINPGPDDVVFVKGANRLLVTIRPNVRGL